MDLKNLPSQEAVMLRLLWGERKDSAVIHKTGFVID